MYVQLTHTLEQFVYNTLHNQNSLSSPNISAPRLKKVATSFSPSEHAIYNDQVLYKFQSNAIRHISLQHIDTYQTCLMCIDVF